MPNQAAQPQPIPTPGQQDVLPEVITDLQARAAFGVKKYGTTLQTRNGRDPLMDAYQESLDQTMYLKQALLERDNPAPTYNWPQTVFVSRNSITDQVAHVLSEADEVAELGPEDSPPMYMELADLHHSLETLWQILERQSGPDYVAAIFQAVENKNRARGYYDLDNQEQGLSIISSSDQMPSEG
jgi:hypothetical protein